jgi:hypothetical protein
MWPLVLFYHEKAHHRVHLHRVGRSERARDVKRETRVGTRALGRTRRAMDARERAPRDATKKERLLVAPTAETNVFGTSSVDTQKRSIVRDAKYL